MRNFQDLMGEMALVTVAFTVLAFSVVTNLYRRSMYPSFERARPGMYISSVAYHH